MLYKSTRGHPDLLSFQDVVFRGLAPDGGLYIPTSIPSVSASQLESWTNLSYSELAAELFSLFIDEDQVSRIDLAEITKRSFGTFTHKEVTPLVKIKETERGDKMMTSSSLSAWASIKNTADSLISTLKRTSIAPVTKNTSDSITAITVVGATSGDTGGAAIYGLRSKDNIEVFILHPKGRVSRVQELQMTTVMDRNVCNVAVEGTFDDCQSIVKSLFAQEEFRKKYNLAAINSINWARILAQISYYFYTVLALRRTHPNITFSVPTGNFGDILAAFFAKQMGLNINLLIATNENDIITRFFRTGTHDATHSVVMTHSPAMDILISSNFERVLWFACLTGSTTSPSPAEAQVADEMIRGFMDQLKATRTFSAPEWVLVKLREWFSAYRVTNTETAQTIKEMYESDSYVLDPHTAVGVHAATQYFSTAPNDATAAMVIVGTASPGKFPDVVLDAVNSVIKNQGGKELTFDDIAPSGLRDMESLPRRCVDVVSGGDVIKAMERVRDVVTALAPVSNL